MSISDAKTIPYNLPLQKDWVYFNGRLGFRQGYLIQIRDGNDTIGYGDCAPLPQIGTETLQQSRVWLADRLNKLAGQSIEAALGGLEASTCCPAARCGLETALLDLQAKGKGICIAKVLNSNAVNQVKVNASLGTLGGALDNLDRSKGYSVIKLKVGLQRVKKEIEQLHRFVKNLPAGTRLRLDANGAWSEAEATTFIQSCEDLPIESIEEPLNAPQLTTLQGLQARTDIEIAIDESLVKFNLKELFEVRPVRRLIIKLMREGGLVPAFGLAQYAYHADMRCVVTTSVDSAIGVWAATHLAAALGNKGQGVAHGLATSSWLREDVGEAAKIRGACIDLKRIKGLGFKPS